MSELMNIPRLRFPEFEVSGINSHINFLFNDLFVFSTGKNIKQSEASPEFTTPCVRYGELYHLYNEVIFEIINRTNIDVSELKFSEGDEILLPSAGEDPSDIGSASALTLPNIAIGRTINILKPKNKNMYSQIYVSYYINQQLRLKISKLAKGVSISNVYNSDLKKLKIWLPSLPEQKKIANSLTAVDNRIELLEKKKTLLETYKKGVMKKIFNQDIRFKDDNGSDFPNWEKKRLGDIGEFKTSSVDKKLDDDEQEIFLVNYMNVYRHEKITNENKYDLMVVTAKPNQIDSNNLIKGDILFTPSSETPDDIGHSVVIFEDLDNTLYSYHLLRFRPMIKIDILYSHYFCNNDLVLNQICRFATGSTRFTISKDSFSKILISLPCFEEQSKIAKFLDSIDKQLELLETQIDKSKTWKKGLLQKMFV